MCSRTFFTSGLALFLAATAYGQVEASGLDDVDPWAVEFLGEDEPRLGESVWSASETNTLLALMRRTRTRNLSPGERTLLQQLVFSAGEAPIGEKSGKLLAERARIMLELGEAESASQIFPLVSEPIGDMEPEETAIDLLLGLDNVESACAASESDARAGAFWAKLRAVCFALDDNAQAAELSLELAISEGVEDPWFYEAVFAAIGVAPTLPPARYDSGIALTLSAKAGLPVPTDGIATSRADLAAAIATNPDLQADLRVQAAGIAAEAGLIDGLQHREAYEALLELEDFEPRTPVELAIAANWTGEETIDTKARMLSAAIGVAEGNIARFHAVSRLLNEDINALPKSAVTTKYGIAFARANLAADDWGGTEEWVSALENTTVEAEDTSAFERAWMLGLLQLVGRFDDEDRSVTAALISAADQPAKRSAMRRLFVLWSALDLPLGPEARGALTSDPTEDGEPVFPMLLRAMNGAATDGAGAELILQTLKLTSGDPSNVRSADMAQILEALIEIGAEDAARQLALESTGFWKREL